MKRILIVPATGLLLALTACGGGSSSTGGTTAAAPPTALASSLAAAAATASTDPGASSSSGAGSLDVCSVLPVGDVSRITGVAYTKTQGNSTMGQIFGCDYSDAQYHLLQVSVTVVNGSIAYDADVQAMSTLQKPIPVTGVGDKAFTVADPKGNAGAAGVAAFASYGALFGDVYIKIGGGYVTPDQGKQLVEEIQGKL
jgi:hypothetical protein